MKDNRFLPVEKREPIEDYEDYAEESSGADDLSIDEADAEELELNHNGKKGHNTLYIAS